MEPRPVIGLELHVKLATRTKLFCSDPNSYEESEPNTNVCPICMGFPGSKPSLNKRAVELALIACLALNCSINKRFAFARKVYFYPDLSKNFQITQYEIPIGKDGYIDVEGRRIRIRRVQIEEDPAKTEHVGGDITSAHYILLDYNRAGTPLIEIVTEPDIASPQEARKVINVIASMLDHIGVFEWEREASLRVDANVSLEGGNRVEVKNITGAYNVEKALSYEIARQKALVQAGKAVERETRHFDELRKATIGLRTKETEEDYGYIFEPDLAFFEITEEMIEKAKPVLEEVPSKKIVRLAEEYGITKDQAGMIVFEGKHLTEFFEECAKEYENKDRLAKWVVGDLLKCLNWNGIKINESKVSKEGFLELLKLIDSGVITERAAKEVIKEYVPTGRSPEEIVREKKYEKIESEEETRKIVDEVIKENMKAYEDYAKGNKEALAFLIGKAIEKTNNRVDPKLVKKLIEARVAQ
ncbi:MAG: Asp-tRNA(Asn)/Glu-tRNA(Gln) amidotransferase subunit GatB [Candidatus Micrarchaeaceae archaeon]